MSDPDTKDGDEILTAFYGCDTTDFDISKDIKERMDRGLTYEEAIREMIDEIKNSSDFNNNLLTEENIEILVKQALEDKELLLG